VESERGQPVKTESGDAEVTAPVNNGRDRADAVFSPEGPGTPVFWTCVRTRPRWEKKFAAFIAQTREPVFLPTVRRETVSHRHRRTTDVVLFPGYVFVARDCARRDFLPGRMVVRLIKPEGSGAILRLHEDLWQVWRGIHSGLYLAPLETLAAGDECEVIAGPMRGVRGRYEKKGSRGQLVLAVYALGTAVAVEIDEGNVRLYR